MHSKVVISNLVHPEIVDLLSSHAEVITNQTDVPLSREALMEKCRDADALIAFMPDSIDETFLKECPNLKIIACALKGYDNFDLDACARRDIWVTIVPDLLTAPTAELAVGLMIAIGRNLGPGENWIRSGQFDGWRPKFYGTSLDGSTIGILGAGAVGKAIARRLAGFRCQLLYHDQTRLDPDQEDDLRMQRAALQELTARSDFIVLALPLTPSTFHLVDDDFVAGMKKGSYLVNPARGSLVKESAVTEALHSGHLAGYAADTFECEEWARSDRPKSIHAGLLEHENVVLTPHLGSAVDVVRREIEREAVENVIQFLNGEPPKGAISGVRVT